MKKEEWGVRILFPSTPFPLLSIRALLSIRSSTILS